MAQSTSAIHGIGQQGQMFWWEGVVENNRDPKGAGRCKVRVIAHNSPSKLDLPTEDLPWAYPLMPLNNPHGKVVALKPGTRVMGHYRDGADGQDLVMLGTINIGYENPGNYDNFDEEAGPVDLVEIAPEKVDRVGEIGFGDDRAGAGKGALPGEPRKVLIHEAGPDGWKMSEISDYGSLSTNEMNTPRLQRGIKPGTHNEAHNLSRTVMVNTQGTEIKQPLPWEPAGKGGTDEMNKDNKRSLYPFNAVEESDSGHFKEVDDTPGYERIKESHRTGTYYEVYPDGTKVTKIVGDDWGVTVRDKNVKVYGTCNIEVIGEANIYGHAGVAVKTDKSAHVQALISATVESTGMTTVKASGKTSVEGTAAVDVISSGLTTIMGGPEVRIEAAGMITMSDATGTAENVDTMIRDLADNDRPTETYLKGKAKVSESSKTAAAAAATTAT